MKTREKILAAIVVSVTIALTCDIIKMDQELQSVVEQTTSYSYETPSSIPVDYGEMKIGEDCYISVCKYQLDDDVYVELDLDYNILKAETVYGYYEKNGISFAFNENDTVRLGKIEF